MTKRRMITQPVYANAYYDQSVAIEFHEMDIAVILANIEYWVTVNELHEKDWDNPVHLHDGKWWTFGSVEYYSKYFPHLTYKQVKVRLQKLEDAGYIVSGNYNKISLDRTKWYTLSDEYRQIRQAEIDAVNSEKNGKNTDSDSPKRVNMLTQTGQSSTTVRAAQMGQAIPDNKPYPDNKQQTDSVMVNSVDNTQDSESTQNSQPQISPLEGSQAKEPTAQQATENPQRGSGLDAHSAGSSLRWPVARKIIKDSFYAHTGKRPMMPSDLEERYDEVCQSIDQPLTLKVLKATLSTYFDTKWIDSPSVRGFLSPKVWGYVGTEEYVVKAE